MLGIPTTSIDYTLPDELQEQILPESSLKYDASLSDDKNIYSLRKQIVAACKKGGYSNKEAEQIATKNVLEIFKKLKNN